VIVVRAMRRAMPLLVLLVVLAGCGGGGSKLDSFDLGGGWQLVWEPDGSAARVQKDGDELPAGGIRIRPLGPDEGEPAAAIPQVAAELSAPVDISNYTVLLDGKPLDVKEGGNTRRRLTVYGAPASSLSSGRHVVVAAARAGGSAAATAWGFTVP
jgi:hypothetical protein